MKPAIGLILLSLTALLCACSGEVDNSEPPALLTSIEAPLELELNWKTDTRAASNSAAYRMRPLLVGERSGLRR